MSLKARLERLDGRRPLTWEVWRQADDDLYEGPHERLTTAQLEVYKRQVPSSVGVIVVRRE